MCFPKGVIGFVNLITGVKLLKIPKALSFADVDFSHMHELS